MQSYINEIEQSIYKTLKTFEENNFKKPHIAIINTNLSDEPSQRYIRNKRKKCESHGISTEVHEPKNWSELRNTLKELNNSEKVTGIIIQYPFADWVQTLDSQSVFDMVNPKKDIDRLHSCWFYSPMPENLPLTSNVLLQLIQQLYFAKEIGLKSKILFYGNGITTNRRLFLQMFNSGEFDCRIINSKTPRDSVKELIEWSEVIVSGIGRRNSLDCEGKIVICPSIIKNEDGSFSSDLVDNKRDKNKVHNIIGGIGKLTTAMLLLRAYLDA